MGERTKGGAAVGENAVTPERVDRRLRAFVLGAVRWRLALGEAFERLGCAGGVRALGFSSTGAYAVERCGFSGRWVEEAAERTVKHLREEVEAVGLVTRTSGARGAMAPPDEATVAAAQAVERAVLAGEPAPPIQMSVAPDEGPRPRTGRVPLRVTVASDVADLWMAVRAMYSRRGAARSFVAALSDNIVRYWTPEVVPDRPFEDVYRRYRCASPTCDRREVGAHHIVFRAHGGSDEAGNLVSLCGRCHVEGVHAGSIGVVGCAPDSLQWELGPVTVAGRVRARPVG